MVHCVIKHGVGGASMRGLTTAARSCAIAQNAVDTCPTRGDSSCATAAMRFVPRCDHWMTRPLMHLPSRPEEVPAHVDTELLRAVLLRDRPAAVAGTAEQVVFIIDPRCSSAASAGPRQPGLQATTALPPDKLTRDDTQQEPHCSATKDRVLPLTHISTNENAADMGRRASRGRSGASGASASCSTAGRTLVRAFCDYNDSPLRSSGSSMRT